MDLPQVAQRGRALISFQAGIAQAANRLRSRAEAELAVRQIDAETLPDDLDEVHAVIDGALAESATYASYHVLADWRARNHGPVCHEAFAEIADQVVPLLTALDQGPTTLDSDTTALPPDYYAQVWFHRTTGGWDASPFNGYVHGELIHKQLLTKIFPGGIFAQRRRVAQSAPKKDYGRILDMGASTGHYTLALAETFPNAAITGIDYSVRMLEHARRVANAAGLHWTLLVRGAEATGLDAESFDLVTSYIVLHELPPRLVNAVFAEAFRLLAPGGDMMMADVPRYADLDRMARWRTDVVAKWGGEPYWRASASMDLKAAAEAAGFVDVEAGGLGSRPADHPYVVRGRKPVAKEARR